MNSLRQSVVISLTTLLAACNGGVSLEALPAEIGAAQCQASDSCGRSIPGFSSEQCSALLTATARNALFDSVRGPIADGTITYDADAAARCVSAVSDTSCDTLVTGPPAACREIFVGTIDAGATCAIDEECAGDAYCGGSCPGSCTPRAAAGGSCSSGSACQTGLTCRDGVCAAPSTGGVCESDFSCALSEVCSMGSCTDRAAIHTAALMEECDPTGTPRCAQGGFCVVVGTDDTGALYECRAPLGSGQSCFIGSICPSTDYCSVDFMSGAVEGTCETLPAAGDSCEASNRCAFGSVCIENTCRARQDNGASCTSPQECWSSNCNAGVCAARSACVPD